MNTTKNHHRKSVRLSGFDYSQEGGYYLTIGTQNREHLFGEIINGDLGRLPVTNGWLLLK